MGKKSRKKRERRHEQMENEHVSFLRDILGFHGQVANKKDKKNPYYAHLEATRDMLRQYNRLDAAIALSVSDLWPANTGSSIKHIFAWVVLLDLPLNGTDGKPITSYTDFKVFAEDLYGVWPEFPTLEDFTPEADWGQIRVRLDSAFVPMFYGSCIERTPDFVEAFRITYAHLPEAQAHMDLAVALQERIIESMASQMPSTTLETKLAYVEVPPEEFWLSCKSTLLEVGTGISSWRGEAGTELDTRFGEFKASLQWDDFCNAVMQGVALPFLAIEESGTWLPISARNAPGVVVDHWANKKTVKVKSDTHERLAQFVAERFQYVAKGPLTLLLGDAVCEDLPISCVISASSGVYLICTCDHASSEQLSNAAKKVYDKMSNGAQIRFLVDERLLKLSKDGSSGPSVEDTHIIIVVTQASTAFGTIMRPEAPARILPLADFITIFDSLNDLEELERYWDFIDSNRRTIIPSVTGAADLYAAFKDMHGVLVDGAVSPAFVGLDTHWGTSWRFKELANFWSLAPSVFPDGSTGWRLSRGTEGVVRLHSRHLSAVAYSTCVGTCTVQAFFDISKCVQFNDAHLIDLFIQILTDCSYRCSELILDAPLFEQLHLLFSCTPDPSSSVCENASPLPIEGFLRVVTSADMDPDVKGLFHLKIDTQAILAGLNASKDGRFEVRCLLEALERCHEVIRSKLPIDIKGRLNGKASEAARYHLRVVTRNIDVPNYVEPVIPSQTDYKLARKHLASEIMALGLAPGRYELSDAKDKIDSASARLRHNIENRLSSLDRQQLLKALIEQHDAVLITERMSIQRTRQSLAHDVEYDRLDVLGKARKDFGAAARHYRYLLEKVVSTSTTSNGQISDNVLRELVGLVDWFMVLTGASDVLHNDIDVGGIEIDDSYIPEVFYSNGSDDREIDFVREYSKSQLGLNLNSEDAVEGSPEGQLFPDKLNNAFAADLGFDFQSMITALAVLSQAQRHHFSDELSLSYAAAPSSVAQVLADSIDNLDIEGANKIVSFLTLSDKDVRRLPGRNNEEGDVPYWEHRKRIHRYAIRPLIVNGAHLCWGAEAVSRAMNNWMSAVRDGYLPADFNWPHVKPIIREIKESIEKKLEHQTRDIFLRHTLFVEGGIDFFKKFKNEGFDDVGDFDVFAYWPDANLLVTVECKYNQPAFTMKDARRLRDRIFGKSESDRNGQFSRILSRRRFIEKNRSRLLELLGWPKSDVNPSRNVELYVSRDIYYWMVNPPYKVKTIFVRVDALDSWLKSELISSN